jgi:hypothetical protein
VEVVAGMLVVVDVVEPLAIVPVVPVVPVSTKAAYTGVIWVAIMAAITEVVIKLCFNLVFIIVSSVNTIK